MEPDFELSFRSIFDLSQKTAILRRLGMRLNKRTQELPRRRAIAQITLRGVVGVDAPRCADPDLNSRS